MHCQALVTLSNTPGTLRVPLCLRQRNGKFQLYNREDFLFMGVEYPVAADGNDLMSCVASFIQRMKGFVKWPKGAEVDVTVVVEP